MKTKVKYVAKNIYIRIVKIWGSCSVWIKNKYLKYVSPPVVGDNNSYLLLLASIIAACLYSGTVMFHSSYISYFGIGSDVISASIKNNILFSYFWYSIFTSIPQDVFYFYATVTVIALLFLRWLYRKGLIFGLFMVTIGLCILFSFKLMPWLGEETAKGQLVVHTIPNGCVEVESYNNFVIIYVSNDRAALIPVEQISENEYKKIGGFAIRKVTELPCILTREDGIIISK